MNAAEILQKAAQTFLERQKVYRDNATIYGETMHALFPQGITLTTADDHHRFHLFALAIVKLTRYVKQWNEGGHSDSTHDAAVYLAMLEAFDANHSV
jgi:hypothetical protein